MSEGAGGDLLSRVQELERARRFETDLRELAGSVGRSLSSTLNLPASLARLCHSAAPLFGARRASAWIHDRRARELVLEASSEAVPRDIVRMPIVSDSPIAAALRRDRPEFITLDGVRALAVPLRGRRRALGLLLFERLGPAPVPEPGVLEGAAELGRQLSSAIENTVLFEDVLRSRRELEDTFNSLADLVVVCDRDLRIANANRAFRERVANRAGETKDRKIVELVGPELAAWLRALDFSGPAAPPDCVVEVNDAALGGYFSVRVTPLRGADRGVLGVVVVARDRTQEVRLEAERAGLRERLAQSEKLAALGQFVAGVAHELNNPLQGVLGHIELLRATKQVPRAMQPEVRVIHREAERAAKIVNNLLVFAGSRTGAHRRVSVNAIVSRIAALRSRTARRQGIHIVRDLDRNLPRVRGDSMLLQQALLNVVVNAEHAIAGGGKNGGRIEIRTRGARGGSEVAVEVRDTGPGIPPDVLPRIFEPFFTTKEVGQGTGLGLALVYGIVHDHGGEISAHNRKEGGAVFRITLPADTMEPRPGA